MTTIDKDEIKPCPVCGKDGALYKYDDKCYVVSCPRYSCDNPYVAVASDRQKAIELWNRMCDG